jgi:hypothetical protein
MAVAARTASVRWEVHQAEPRNGGVFAGRVSQLDAVEEMQPIATATAPVLIGHGFEKNHVGRGHSSGGADGRGVRGADAGADRLDAGW